MIDRTGTAHISTIASPAVLTRAAWIVGFAALTAVAAQVEIPHQPIPYTLQTLAVLLAGATLGRKDGALALLTYLGAGLIGLPVFAHMSFGFAKIIGPSGGYLMSFPIAAFVVGYVLREERDFVNCLIAMALGLFVVFTLGTIHLNFVYTHNLADAIYGGFLIFSWWDLAKLVTAASVASLMGKGSGNITNKETK